MKYLAILVIVLLVGCNEDIKAKRDAKQNALFVQCMQLASSLPRQGDDDVADIIDECDSMAYWQAH